MLTITQVNESHDRERLRGGGRGRPTQWRVGVLLGASGEEDEEDLFGEDDLGFDDIDEEDIDEEDAEDVEDDLGEELDDEPD
jgi:hypothetical protein